MFSNASNFVHGVDLTFAVILGISLFFLLSITGVMIYFVVKYSRKKNPKATNIEKNNKLEIIWTVIPTLLVLVMFYYGWHGYKPMRDFPKESLEINAYGQMWKWSFEYPDGRVLDTLVVPKDKAVTLHLISRDVLHSLYIPAFRIKEDVVPGDHNKMWFIAQQEGDFDITCAEYCGDRHSYMRSKVVVLPSDKYDSWYTESKNIVSNEPEGLQIMKKNACLSCHTLDGSKLVGPSFKGIWGETVTVVTDGKERDVKVDEEYIRRSIKDPNADVVKGFNPGLMINYKDIVTDQQIDQIIDYIKTLK